MTSITINLKSSILDGLDLAGQDPSEFILEAIKEGLFDLTDRHVIGLTISEVSEVR